MPPGRGARIVVGLGAEINNSLDPGEAEFGSDSTTVSGWVYGVSVCRLIGPRWSIGIECRVLDLGTETFQYDGDIDDYGIPWRFNVDTEIDLFQAVLSDHP